MRLKGEDGYILLYDFLDQPPRIFAPLLCFGVAIFGYYLIKSSFKEENLNKKNEIGISESFKRFLSGFVMLIFGILLGFYILNLSDYFKTRTICKQNNLTVTSGYVTDFEARTLGKNPAMSFSVNQKRFGFSSRDLTYYGCEYQDLEDSDIQDSTFLEIYSFNKNGRNIVVKVRSK